jgi:CheY-like chemotaxis protein
MNDDTGQIKSQIILVVDDEALIRMDISDILRAQGYDVIEAFNADEALKTLARGTLVDLVFSDIFMPGKLDGIDLARYVAAEFGLPVLLTSGHAASADIPEAIRPLISKPYNSVTVVEEIHRRLQLHRRFTRRGSGLE